MTGSTDQRSLWVNWPCERLRDRSVHACACMQGGAGLCRPIPKRLRGQCKEWERGLCGRSATRAGSSAGRQAPLSCCAAWSCARLTPTGGVGLRLMLRVLRAAFRAACRRVACDIASCVAHRFHSGFQNPKPYFRVGTVAPKLGWALSEIRFRAESAHEVVHANCTLNQTIAFAVSTFGRNIPD